MQFLFVCKVRAGAVLGDGEWGMGNRDGEGDPILNLPGHSEESGERLHKPLQLF